MDKINGKPSDYCGYIIYRLHGNLQSRWSVFYKQNHTVVTSDSGNSNTGWSIRTHISQLMKKTHDHSKKRNELGKIANILAYKYSLKHDGQVGFKNAMAKKSLSPFA